MAPKRARNDSVKKKKTKTSRRQSAKTSRQAVPNSKQDQGMQVMNFLTLVWGSNSFGQLGLGSNLFERPKPYPLHFDKKVSVPYNAFKMRDSALIGTQVRQIALGGMHSLVLLEDDTLWSFGVNDEGALGRETKTDEETDEPIEGVDATIPGRVSFPVDVGPVQQIICTDSASFVLLKDGTVYGWGTFRNSGGVFGMTPSEKIAYRPIVIYRSPKRNPVVRMSAGNNHIVAVMKDGTALSWGNGDEGQLGRISARHSSRAAVRKSTMLTPTKIGGMRRNKLEAAFCGEMATFMKTTTGKFYSCGVNHCGQLAVAPLNDPTAQGRPTRESQVDDCTLILTPTHLDDHFDSLQFEDIAMGRDHGLGRSSDGTLYSWGAETYGVLGREGGTSTDASVGGHTPMEIDTSEIGNVVDIACGQIQSGCVNSDGDLFTWGAATDDLLGHGGDDDEDIETPRKIKRTKRTEKAKFHQIHFGGQHAAALSVEASQ